MRIINEWQRPLPLSSLRNQLKRKKEIEQFACVCMVSLFTAFRMLRVLLLLLLAADILQYIVCAQYIGSPREFKIKRNAGSHMIYLEL